MRYLGWFTRSKAFEEVVVSRHVFSLGRQRRTSQALKLLGPGRILTLSNLRVHSRARYAVMRPLCPMHASRPQRARALLSVRSGAPRNSMPDPRTQNCALITGANGFLGRAIVAQLLTTPTAVRALVLPGESVPDQWAGRVQVVRGDITHFDSFAAAARGCDTLYHLAALVGDSGPEARHQTVTVGGAKHAVEVALLNRLTLLLASSIAVYGDRIGRTLCTETTPPGQAQGPYSRAKQAQEQLVRDAQEKRGLDAIIVRPANIYGPGSGPWLHDLGHELKRGRPVLIGGGEFEAGLTHVANVADVFVRAAQLPYARGATLLAVDGLGITWKRYLTDLAQLLGAPAPGVLPYALAKLVAGPAEQLWPALRLKGRPPITREALNLIGHANLFDNSATRTLLGLSPRVDYAAGMTSVARYVLEHGLDR
jgi:nucleoside-diphosphate-sugar epimerase